MERSSCLELIEKHVKSQHLKKHMLATEAVMRHLAGRFQEDPELWGLTGLLHDLDVDLTSGNTAEHGNVTCRMLEAEGYPAELLYAIKVHVEKEPAKSLMDKALYAVDPLTGFLVACALMTPGKKMAGVDLDFAKRRFKEKRFAAGASREQMNTCETLGMTLDELMEAGLSAMKDISSELGL
ncbi:MAG: HD domain-containing protein [bacterium]